MSAEKNVRNALIVDARLFDAGNDGIATGSTMNAAIAALRQQEAARIVVTARAGAEANSPRRTWATEEIRTRSRVDIPLYMTPCVW